MSKTSGIVELRAMSITNGATGSKSFLPEFLSAAMAEINGIERAFLFPENMPLKDQNDQIFVECFRDLERFAPFSAGDYLFIDRSGESGAIRSRLALLNDLAASIDIDPRNIIYVSQNPHVALSPSVCGPNWLWFHHYIVAMSRAHRNVCDDFGFLEAPSNILCLNNKRRGHRIAFVKAARERFGERLIFSWLASPWDRADEDYAEHYPTISAMGLPEPPSCELNPTLGGPSALGLPEAAIRETFLHLVLETEVSNYSQRFTEKILKPLVAHRPFLVFGPKGTLQRLRRLGFRTFHNIFPEDYDHIDNREERMFRILDIAGELLLRDQPRLKSDVLEICAYNQRHLLHHIENSLGLKLSADLSQILSLNSMWAQLSEARTSMRAQLSEARTKNRSLEDKLLDSCGEYDLLLHQLQQVQEQLEYYFLDAQRLYTDLQGNEQQLERQRARSVALAEALRFQKSLYSKLVGLLGRVSLPSVVL